MNCSLQENFLSCMWILASKLCFLSLPKTRYHLIITEKMWLWLSKRHFVDFTAAMQLYHLTQQDCSAGERLLLQKTVQAGGFGLFKKK